MLCTVHLAVYASHCTLGALTIRCLQGAFSVAAKAGMPVVPITLLGTGKMMPNKKENLLFNGSARIIVHPRVEPQNANNMLTETRDKIKSRLPPSLVHPQQNIR